MAKKCVVGFTILLTSTFLAGSLGAQNKPITVGIIGDSTVASTYGWGPAFAKHCNEQAKVLNYAKNGATLQSLSTKYDALLEQRPEYVLIQFGHNDMKRYDANTYALKLKDYVERATAAGSRVIVLSSVTRRTFNRQGEIVPRVVEGDRTLPQFAKAAKAVAYETKVPFIDLNSITIRHHNMLGPEASASYNFNETDRTHFSEYGAAETAQLIAAEMKSVVPELAAYLKPVEEAGSP